MDLSKNLTNNFKKNDWGPDEAALCRLRCAHSKRRCLLDNILWYLNSPIFDIDTVGAYGASKWNCAAYFYF